MRGWSTCANHARSVCQVQVRHRTIVVISLRGCTLSSEGVPTRSLQSRSRVSSAVAQHSLRLTELELYVVRLGHIIRLVKLLAVQLLSRDRRHLDSKHVCLRALFLRGVVRLIYFLSRRVVQNESHIGLSSPLDCLMG